MDADDIVREIQRKNPGPPRYRAAKGQWVKPAHAVRKLVKKGWGVSDAVREVVGALKLHPPESAFKGVRAAYYEVLKHESKPE